MAIKLNNITKKYDDKVILNAINLSINKNSLTCLLGSSGSGKTTILRLIAGLENAEKGNILIDDVLATENKSLKLLPHQRNIGYIFQDLALWPHFTIYKNIAFGLQEQKTANIKEKVDEILNYFNLIDEANKYPHQLSGGQQQLVTIARALVLKPKILLMDEPLANLDVKLKRKTLSLIKDLKDTFNLTIIYVTHDHKEAFAIADDIVVLNKGKIETSGTVSQLKTSKNKYVKYFLEY